MNVRFLFEVLWISIRGIPITLLITVGTLLVALPLGFLLGLIRFNRIRGIDHIIFYYVSLVRGIPIVIQIFLIFNIVPRLIFQMTQSSSIFHVNPLFYAFLVFWINYTAMLSEVFRSALYSVNRRQLDAAYSIGLTKFQAYFHVIIPQMLVNALPNIGNLSLSLLKATSLVYLMGIQDITALAKIAASRNLNYFEAYVAIFLIYLILCYLVNNLMRMMERHFSIYKLTTNQQ